MSDEPPGALVDTIEDALTRACPCFHFATEPMVARHAARVAAEAAAEWAAVNPLPPPTGAADQ